METTDSELMFYLVQTFGLEESPLTGLERMVGFIEKICGEMGIDDPMQLSAGPSDGEHLLAVRYSTEQRSRALFHSMDLPAELYLQNLNAVLQDHALPRGTLTWRGQRVEPGAISRAGQMTVEGEYDDVSGSGQTRAAQELCQAIPSRKRRHLLQAGIGHFGMYPGRSWFESVLPQVRDFIRGQS